MTRSEAASTYDQDFFLWTQEQAAALRRVPGHDLGCEIDVEHLAEEVEDLGKRELREVASFIELLFRHLMKLDAFRDAPSVAHWRSEARMFRRSALDAYTPSMRQLLDLPKLWLKAQRTLTEDLEDQDLKIAPPGACPFDMTMLLAEEFDLDVALAEVAAARGALSSTPAP